MGQRLGLTGGIIKPGIGLFGIGLGIDGPRWAGDGFVCLVWICFGLVYLSSKIRRTIYVKI